jgi:prefoldin subunit 5
MDLLVLGYVVVLLRAAFLGGDHCEEGRTVEVDRNGRNAMIAGGIARDATDAEIAAYRGGTGGGGADDGNLSEAQAQLSALEGQHKTLAEEVGSLGVTKGELAREIDDLGSAKKTLADEVLALEQSKTALAAEVADLEKAKKAAAKAPK